MLCAVRDAAVQPNAHKCRHTSWLGCVNLSRFVTKAWPRNPEASQQSESSSLRGYLDTGHSCKSWPLIKRSRLPRSPRRRRSSSCFLHDAVSGEPGKVRVRVALLHAWGGGRFPTPQARKPSCGRDDSCRQLAHDEGKVEAPLLPYVILDAKHRSSGLTKSIV